MQIQKSDGSIEQFQGSKIEHAMQRAKVSESAMKEVLETVPKMIRTGTSTNTIHQRVLHILEEIDPTGAARFNLKHSMLQLGPTGFPFEHYFARLMNEYGWTTKVGVTLMGRCVSHEVDVYGKREGSKDRAVEAKYHNSSGRKTDIKTALYVYGRHEDLQARDANIRGVLVTNTQFTKDAIAYGECMEMKMKGWNYPKNEGLAKYIEDKELYPVTVFSKIPKHSISKMTHEGLVLASELCSLSTDDAKRFGIGEKQLKELQGLTTSLCHMPKKSS
ncbi:MAG TPA: restriction endonuclease [Patescibacteria group bacterium]|nr:restriction endonuclease [Patescibacteria group bacterium]